MTKRELMNCLHQYTPWEMFHMENLGLVQDIENLNRTLEYPITENEKSYGLHLPNTPDVSSNTFTENIFFTDDKECDISIIQHDRYTPSQLHAHDFFEFLYVYEGEFVQQIENTKLLMHSGDFCMIPPHVHHALDVHNYSIVLNILIPKHKFQNIIMNHLKGDHILSLFFINNTYSQNINNYIIFHTNGDVNIQNIILDMCLEVINKEEYYLHFLNTQLLLLFGHLLRDYSSTCELPTIKTKKDSQNFAILKYIESNYDTVTLHELADYFHYSTQHMSRRLKQLTGMSFSQYLLTKKMEVSSNLLINTNMKIASISETIGYSNPEHFMRVFRKYYNMTPSAYRTTHHRPSTAETTVRKI
ncbi:MAG TPA: AraC family transcriptional regulator [Candidatus Merdenecus merdavium]|nr:AraC family transcriptional regulator [Candidatus Merdenecus merdavium]